MFNRFRGIIIALGALALVLGGCRLEEPPNAVYRCKADADCLSGDRCLEGLCRSPASLAQGEPSKFTCNPSCNADRQLCCEEGCVDPATDRENCGVCGKKCESGQSCLGGRCVAEVCDNGLDDNADGKTDCADSAVCPDRTTCRAGVCCGGQCVSESTAELCSNGVDDDCDGKKDCEDPKCLGQRCSDGKVCGESGCAAGCSINGVVYADGAPNPQSPCFQCNVAVSGRAWSKVPARTTSGTCTDGLACDGSGRCSRVDGRPCAAPSDCISGKCSTAGACVP